MTDEEYRLWRQHMPENEMRDLYQLEYENDKIVQREEKEKVGLFCLCSSLEQVIFCLYKFNFLFK